MIGDLPEEAWPDLGSINRVDMEFYSGTIQLLLQRNTHES